MHFGSLLIFKFSCSGPIAEGEGQKGEKFAQWERRKGGRGDLSIRITIIPTERGKLVSKGNHGG